MDPILRDKTLSLFMNNLSSLKQATIALSDQTVAECRQKEHWKAKIQMLEGNYQGAVSTLSTAITKYGPHIGLRVDLATSYYLMGVPRLFEKALTDIELDYPEILKHIHPVNQVKTSLMIGKLLEERGRVAVASKIYKEALVFIEDEIVEPTWFYDYGQAYLRLLAQVLRFTTQFEFIDEAHRAFRLLQQSNKSEVLMQDAKDDLGHAIHLYHLRFTDGYECKDLLELSEQTRQLCYFETLEMKLRQHIINNYVPSKIMGEDAYDHMLLLLNKQSWPELDSFLNKNVAKLSTASLIRIFYISQNIRPGTASVEIKSLVNAILLDLSDQDQILWRRWGNQKKLRASKLILRHDTLIIECATETRTVDLKKKQLIIKLLQCLNKKNEWPWEELVMEIWGHHPDLSTYDRLRMLVARANAIVSPEDRLFELREYKLSTQIVISLGEEI